MSVLAKLERGRVAAEIASIDQLLARLTAADVFMREDLEDRRNELATTLETLADDDEVYASAALYFGGRPVVASVGIEAGFGGDAVAKFQDLISKLMVQEQGLGQRGPVPNKAASTMHITNVVRGSFGFLMQEVRPQTQLVKSGLPAAVASATRLIAALGAPNDEEFQEIAGDVDQRALATASEFFGLMKNNGATFRLVAGDSDRSFTGAEIALAAERALETSIEEEEQDLLGTLEGTLPYAHAFEFRTTTGALLNGKVDPGLTSDTLANWNASLLGASVNARIVVRRVKRNGAVIRETYRLLSLTPQDGAAIEQVHQLR